MRKLFTLIALLAICFGANAKTVQDGFKDFSKETELSGWWSDQCKDRFKLEDGVLKYVSSEATTNNWDVQWWIMNGMSFDSEYTYNVTFYMKGNPAGTVGNVKLGDWSVGVDNYGKLNFSTEWQECTIQVSGDNLGGDGILFQCGSYIGELQIGWIKVTHEEAEDATPVKWRNRLTNGDAEGKYGEIACAQSKEFGQNLDAAGNPQPHDAEIMDMDGGKVFVVHSKAVVPPLVWEDDADNHKAGDAKPDNAWQNQFWITFPKPLKAGEPLMISFKYKASKAVKVATQGHRMPGNYLDNGQVGELSFTTEWKTFEKQIKASAETQSLAFNLGSDIYTEDIDFYFDDLALMEMDLEPGYFVASSNPETLIDYDFANATKFEADEDEQWAGAITAVVGTPGKKDSWVTKVMIATGRGNTKGFKASTIKLNGAIVNSIESWVNFVPEGNIEISLPVAGVWKIGIDEENTQICFVKLEGEKDKEVLDIKANPTKVVVKAVEREYLQNEAPEGYEFKKDAEDKDIVGQPWDNQFFILANRPLKAGEVTYVEFKYKSSIPAKTTVQYHGQPGEYKGNGLAPGNEAGTVNDVNFTETENTVKATFTIPNNAEGVQSIAFNMAEIKEACDYEIYDIIWRLDDKTETLINETGADNFIVKVGAGTNPVPAAIAEVAAAKKAVPTITVNLAGQRVSKDYKGIVIKGGKAVLNK